MVPLATALNDLAWILLSAGRPNDAVKPVEESLFLFSVDGELSSAGAPALHTAAAVAVARRWFDRAAKYATLALTMPAVDIDNMVYNLEGLAITAVARAEPERGLRLFAAAQQIRKKTSLVATPVWQSMLEAAVRDAHRDLRPSHARRAIADGQQLTPDESVSYALHDTWPTARTDSRSGLTPREHQVAEAVAQGLTNQQIAARLHIAPRTVVSHLGAIRSKLSLPTRAHVVAWITADQARAESADLGWSWVGSC